jgi:hypothetical protein
LPCPSIILTHPNRPASRRKPAKPYPEFPLTAHPAGYWCKKIRGKVHYFGPWSDPQAALDKYLEQKDALHAGKKPRDSEAATVKSVANAFLNAKRALLEAGELSPHTFANYKRAAVTLVPHLGKGRLVADSWPTSTRRTSPRCARRWRSGGGRTGWRSPSSTSAPSSSMPLTPT